MNDHYLESAKILGRMYRNLIDGWIILSRADLEYTMKYRYYTIKRKISKNKFESLYYDTMITMCQCEHKYFKNEKEELKKHVEDFEKRLKTFRNMLRRTRP